jgi:hypothetical protein
VPFNLEETLQLPHRAPASVISTGINRDLRAVLPATGQMSLERRFVPVVETSRRSSQSWRTAQFRLEANHLLFAGCVGGQLTTNELQKCLTVGIDGAGCFGDNKAIVKAVSDVWKGIAGGPNSVFNNPGQLAGGPNSMINNPGQITGGPNSVINNPGQLAGGSNSVANNPGQILGGSNSVIRNPGQLVPPPVNLGTVGGHRVCIPWC